MNLDGIDPHWLWLIAATSLAIAELVVPGVFLIWVAAAAAVTGLVTMLLGLALPSQFVLFALVALASVWFGRRWYAAHEVASSDPKLNDRAARLIGSSVKVVEAIENGRGRVRVGDSIWNARGNDAREGAHVRVVGADGTCLIVEAMAPPLSGPGAEPGPA